MTILSQIYLAELCVLSTFMCFPWLKKEINLTMGLYIIVRDGNTIDSNVQLSSWMQFTRWLWWTKMVFHRIQKNIQIYFYFKCSLYYAFNILFLLIVCQVRCICIWHAFSLWLLSFWQIDVLFFQFYILYFWIYRYSLFSSIFTGMDGQKMPQLWTKIQSTCI